MPKVIQNTGGAGSRPGAAGTAGVAVHVGHGLDYRNVVPVLQKRVAGAYSIGFSIVARAVFVGLKDAVAEMKRIMEVYS